MKVDRTANRMLLVPPCLETDLLQSQIAAEMYAFLSCESFSPFGQFDRTPFASRLGREIFAEVVFHDS